MRISDIINLGMEYMILGVSLVVVLGIGLTLWYFLYFKRKRHEKDSMSRKYCFVVFFLYI